MHDLVFRAMLPLCWLALLAGLAVNRRRVARSIGRDPVVIRPLEARDTAESYLEWLLLASVGLLTLDIGANAVAPAAARTLAIEAMRASAATGSVGLVLLACGTCMSAVAIRQMGTSWRIGIDSRVPGPVVTRGLYGRIRHPIYTGMLLSTTGVALVTADIVAIAVAATAAVALPIQARLEEAFLLSKYGQEYSSYLERTKRFWPF